MTDIIAAVSQEIRRVDGNHTMGAGALAEALHAAGLLAPDLPKPDWDGYLWPAHGRNYGNVHTVDALPLPGGEPVPGVVISRGGRGHESRQAPIRMTAAEARELALLLLAAADHATKETA